MMGFKAFSKALGAAPLEDAGRLRGGRLGVAISVLVTGWGVAEYVFQGWPGSWLSKFSLANYLFGSDPDWFHRAPKDPQEPAGIPGWAFIGTWLGLGGNARGEGAAPLLDTMPLVP